ncbi:hypothetical protein [Chachezhania sediminis]|uniref:hypothetical protein n=1 Tax=Chachezhania sediminis TaxID=2599291 RepID=UPI001E31E966|nr:hypothetical protein [Chachezhania sediminis]
MTQIRPKTLRHRLAAMIAALGAAATTLPTAGAAQEGRGITLELSAAQDRERSCLLSFLAQNGMSADIDSAVYEVVLFDASGAVSQLTLLDFETLPAGRPRVRQFAFPGKGCGDISRILINGAETCTGDGVDAGACTDGLDLNSRVAGTELIG